MNSVLNFVKIIAVLNLVKFNFEFLWLYIDGSVLEGQFYLLKHFQ